jgi:DNA-binding XRE family transcriptional regulator
MKNSQHTCTTLVIKKRVVTGTQLTTRITHTATKPEGYTFGRPTKFKPEYCGLVVEWGNVGLSKAQMCSKLNISRSTMFVWEKAHTDFSYAIEEAVHLAQAYMENIALEALEKPTSAFNTALWCKIVSCRFPSVYRASKRH